MRKGLLVDIQSDYILVMTKDGDFKRLPNKQYNLKVGDCFYFKDCKESRCYKTLATKSMKVAFAAVAALFLLISQMFLLDDSSKVYAYMAIDINPSLELSVNEKLQVVDIIPFNRDAELVLDRLTRWKRQDIEDVTKRIIDICEEEGYLNNRKVVLTTIIVEENNNRHSKLKKAIAEITVYSSEKKHSVVVSREATLKERNISSELNISVGKHLDNLIKEEEKRKKNPSVEGTPVQSKEVPALKKAEPSKIEINKREQNTENSVNFESISPVQVSKVNVRNTVEKLDSPSIEPKTTKSIQIEINVESPVKKGIVQAESEVDTKKTLSIPRTIVGVNEETSVDGVVDAKKISTIPRTIPEAVEYKPEEEIRVKKEHSGPRTILGISEETVSPLELESSVDQKVKENTEGDELDVDAVNLVISEETGRTCESCTTVLVKRQIEDFTILESNETVDEVVVQSEQDDTLVQVIELPIPEENSDDKNQVEVENVLTLVEADSILIEEPLQ